MSSLPEEITEGTVFEPVEELGIAVLRDYLPEAIRVQSLIEADQVFPFVLVRRTADWGWPGGDERFLDSANLTISAFADGLEADGDAARLAEAVRLGLYAGRNKVFAGLGYIVGITRLQTPRQVSDWATAVGPVQYASLPTGVMRYEAVYRVSIRAPRD